MTAAQVLRDAADVLVRDGWCQHTFHQGRRHCAAHAVEATGGAGDELQAAFHALNQLVGWIGAWNDREGQTAANVVATLRSLADSLDAA